MAFATWSALLNNFVIEVAGFDGGRYRMAAFRAREIPGFLAIGVSSLLLVIREQKLALLSLIMLGVATALTAQFPPWGIVDCDADLFHRSRHDRQSILAIAMDRQSARQTIGWLMSMGSWPRSWPMV